MLAGLAGQEVGETVRRDTTGIAVSPLVSMECRVAPLRRGDTLLARRYEQLIEGLTMPELDHAVCRDAAALRARYGFSTLDALHLATARFHGCEAFWTYDRRLAAAAGGLAIDVIRRGLSAASD